MSRSEADAVAGAVLSLVIAMFILPGAAGLMAYGLSGDEPTAWLWVGVATAVDFVLLVIGAGLTVYLNLSEQD